MQFGQRHRQALGVALCVAALGVAAVATGGDDTLLAGAKDRVATVIDIGSRTPDGGSIVATVSWPQGAAERSNICVVVFDDDGGVDDRVGRLKPVPGSPVSGRWTAGGLAAGRYTVYVAQCVTPDGARARIKPQFLGGGSDAEAATWVDVASGDRVHVGTIDLRRTGLQAGSVRKP